MADILHETESLCPICLKKIPARYERIDGKAYMIKACPEHGEFKVLFWRDADMYERWMRQGVHAPAKDRGKPEKLGCPYDCGPLRRAPQRHLHEHTGDNLPLQHELRRLLRGRERGEVRAGP